MCGQVYHLIERCDNDLNGGAISNVSRASDRTVCSDETVTESVFQHVAGRMLENTDQISAAVAGDMRPRVEGSGAAGFVGARRHQVPKSPLKDGRRPPG